MNRRNFLLSTGIFLTGAALLVKTSKAQAEEGRRKKDQDEMVSEKDNLAKSVGYVEDTKKAAKANGNKCSGCSLYKKVKDINGREVGTCALFQQKYVYGNAYCNSWAKKV